MEDGDGDGVLRGERSISGAANTEDGLGKLGTALIVTTIQSSLGRRPRRFYFKETAVPSVYTFVLTYVLANVANAPPVAGYSRYLPRRFISSPSAAPTAPLGLLNPASSESHQFHLDLDGSRPGI